MFSPPGIAGWIELSGYLGVVSIGACLLIIGGEFDLSIGSMIGFVGVVIGVQVAVFDWPPWLAILIAIALALVVGFLNGFLVVRTRLASFIVTLATLFILRGFAIAGSRAFTNQSIIGGMHDKLSRDWLAQLLGGEVGGSFFAWLAAHGVIATSPTEWVARGERSAHDRDLVGGAQRASCVVHGSSRRSMATGSYSILGGDANAARDIWASPSAR